MREILNRIRDGLRKLAQMEEDIRYQRDYDPEHIRAFPYHKLDCTKTGPLQIVYEINPPMCWGTPPVIMGGTPIKECSECHGRKE